MRLLAVSLLMLLATGCAVVPLDGGYYGHGYSHHYDRDRYGDRDHRDHDGNWHRNH